MDIFTSTIAVANIFFACILTYTAFQAIKHFKVRNIYEQWMVSLSDVYHRHNVNVIHLINRGLSNESMIEEIENRPELRESVNYMLDYLSIKATSIRFKIVDRKLSIRAGYNSILYYYKHLKPWMIHLRKIEGAQTVYSDFDWLYAFCEKYETKIVKSKS